MAWLIIFAALAAWGLLSACWAALGWLLPGSGSATVVLLYPRTCPEDTIARYRWLRSLGLIRGRLVIADAEDTVRAVLERKYPDLEFCALAELTAGPEAEREQLD